MVKVKEKHMIWTSDYLFSDYEDFLREECPEADEQELWDMAADENDRSLDDERANLDIQLAQQIIVIGDLGRWNGRVTGYRMIESGKISDCLYGLTNGTTSDIEWYVDENGDLRANEHHHDGSNRYLYRVLKDTVTDEDVWELQDSIYMGQVTVDMIKRLTNRLGDEIGNVYGWDFEADQLEEI